ncbi:hypothetical protein [Nocardia abscessus]|uniref:hypothetical protein n=1 Tax=Nocardia abscessus TaxID=120957 RepID=UPI00245738CE|nr:hypothetical protein [Nocardia abscessus]
MTIREEAGGGGGGGGRAGEARANTKQEEGDWVERDPNKQQAQRTTTRGELRVSRAAGPGGDISTYILV